MKRVLLEMYLQKNLGDDLFLQMIAQRYPDVEFDILAKSSYLKGWLQPNVRGQNLADRLVRKIDTIRGTNMESAKYDAKVVLGGSMFIDGGLDKEALEARTIQRLGYKLPLFILGANFGPYHNDYYYNIHKKHFKRAEDICFRERYSARLFRDLGNVRVAPDIVFGLDTSKYDARQEKKVIISVINLGNRASLKDSLEDYENKIVEVANKYSGCGYEVVLMSFCKYEGDEDATSRIIAKARGSSIRPYYYNGNMDEALRQIASSEIIIGTRFHSVVLGLVFGKKVLPIIYSEKTRNMLKDTGYSGKMVDIGKVTELEVDNLDTYLGEFSKIDELSEGAGAHFEKLDKFLGRSR